MDDLKLVIGLDGSMWVSHAEDVDMVPAVNSAFVYHMGELIKASNTVLTGLDEHRYARVEKRTKAFPQPIKQPPSEKRR